MSIHSGYLWSRLIHIRGARAVAFLLLSGGVFAAIAACIHLPGLNLLDLDVTRAVQHYRTVPMDFTLYTASALGNSLTLMLIVVAVAVVLLYQRHRRAALLTVLTLLSLPLNELLKGWAVRPRPDADAVMILMPRVGMSFPSGHAMGSTAVYGFLAALVWLRGSPGAFRTTLTIVLALLPLLIGLSRIYVGAHWLSDVVAGIAAGSFVIVPLVSAYKHWHRVTPPESGTPGGPIAAASGQ